MVNADIFIEALNDTSLAKMHSIPKSDLHNHAGRGGRLSYFKPYIPPKTEPFPGIFSSIEEMNLWLKQNVTCYLPQGSDNYLKRVEASFVAAVQDNIVRLALDFGLSEIFALGGTENFIKTIDRLHKTFAPKTEFLPTIVIRDENGLENLDEIFSYNWFDAIDIINYDNLLSRKTLKVVCEFAKANGLKCKAHIGEYGSAEDVLRYVEEFNLDEVQHGIKVADSPVVLNRLADKNILFNLCPTSNIKLGLCSDYSTHPIETMLKHGLNVTVNTDDLIIFDSSVSEEFIKLYRSGVLSGKELYQVYCNGMNNTKI